MSIENNEQNKESAFIIEADSFISDEPEGVRLLREERERMNSLERPHISVWRALLNIFIPLAVCAALFCALYFTLPEFNLAISLGVSLGLLGVYIIARTKSILIWFIKLYQATAPAKVRLRCVFTPTCSQYAIAALNKYGVIKGLPKIISRLHRCHPPNGGTDEP